MFSAVNSSSRHTVKGFEQLRFYTKKYIFENKTVTIPGAYLKFINPFMTATHTTFFAPQLYIKSGVTDISLMFDVTWSDFSNSDFIRYTAKEMIGDPDQDAAQLKATSPLENVARIKAPVLLAYGGGDHRVPVVHGEKMRDALLKQGTPVEWVFYSDEGHGFGLEANRLDFYERVARFLDASIGANAPKRSAPATAAQ